MGFWTRRDNSRLLTEKIRLASGRWRLDSGYWCGRVTMVAVLLLAGMFVVRLASGSNGWAAYRNKRIENLRLQQQVQQLERENEELEEHIKALKSAPAAIEKEAREQLGYARPGETVYVLQPRRPDPAAQPSANATVEKR